MSPPNEQEVIVDYGTHKVSFPDSQTAQKFAPLYKSGPKPSDEDVKSFVSQFPQQKIDYTRYVPQNTEQQPKESSWLDSLASSRANSATFGQAAKGKAFLRTLTEPVSAFEKHSYLPWRDEQYQRNLQDIYKEDSEAQWQNPGYAIAGNILGLTQGPGGQLFKGVGKIVNYGGKALTKAVPLLEKTPGFIKGLVGAGATGGLGNVAYTKVDQILNPDNQALQQQTMGDAAKTGAMFGAGGYALGQGLKYAANSSVGNKISNAVSPITARIQGMIEETPVIGGYFKGGKASRMARFQNNVDKVLTDSGASDPVTVSKNLGDTVQTSKKALSNRFDDLVNPILEKHADTPASAEKLRQAIVDEFKFNNLVDSKGNFKIDVLNKLPSNDPTRKTLESLAQFSETLKENPTLGELNLIKKSLQNMAKFESSNRSPMAATYGRLSNAAKDSMSDNVQKLVGNEGLSNYLQGMGEYSKKIPVLNTLLKIGNKAPEKVPVSVKNLQGSALTQMVQNAPELQQPLEQSLVNSLLSNATSPRNLTKAIDRFGRDSLKAVLSPKTYQAFERLEASDSNLFIRALNEIIAPQTRRAIRAKSLNRLGTGIERGGKYIPPIMTNMEQRQ